MDDRSATNTWHVTVAGVEHVVSLGGPTSSPVLVEIPLHVLEVDSRPVAPARSSLADMARSVRPLIAGVILLGLLVVLVWGVLSLAAR